MEKLYKAQILLAILLFFVFLTIIPAETYDFMFSKDSHNLEIKKINFDPDNYTLDECIACKNAMSAPSNASTFSPYTEPKPIPPTYPEPSNIIPCYMPCPGMWDHQPGPKTDPPLFNPNGHQIPRQIGLTYNEEWHMREQYLESLWQDESYKLCGLLQESIEIEDPNFYFVVEFYNASFDPEENGRCLQCHGTEDVSMGQNEFLCGECLPAVINASGGPLDDSSKSVIIGGEIYFEPLGGCFCHNEKILNMSGNNPPTGPEDPYGHWRGVYYVPVGFSYDNFYDKETMDKLCGPNCHSTISTPTFPIPNEDPDTTYWPGFGQFIAPCSGDPCYGPEDPRGFIEILPDHVEVPIINANLQKTHPYRNKNEHAPDPSLMYQTLPGSNIHYHYKLIGNEDDFYIKDETYRILKEYRPDPHDKMRQGIAVGKAFIEIRDKINGNKEF